jgi:alcohol dehydrogenase class IV
MGATAFQKGLGAMHAMSHPCSARHDSHHGLTNAVVMPYVLEFNRPAIEARLGDLARWLNLKPVSFAGVMDWVLELRGRLAIPHRLDALGIAEADIDTLAVDAAADPLTGLNPRPLGEEDYRRLYGLALAGRLG